MTHPTVFTNAFLISATGRSPEPNTTVVINDGRIQDILPSQNDMKFSDAQVFNLDGRTLMPGLIDAHVHPGNVEMYLHQTIKLPPAVYVHRVSQTLETDLQLGFTTLRDAAGLDDGFRSAIDQGLIKGPRLMLCVTPLTLGKPGEKPDPRNSLGICPEICESPEQVRQAVERTLERGADHIKVFADGEVMSQSQSDTTKPGEPKFTVEALRAAVETAEAQGAYVMAHAYGPKAVQNCIQAGIRSIEHGNLMDEGTIQMMIANGTYYVPTLSPFDERSIRSVKAQLDARSLEKLAIVSKKGRIAFEMAYRAGVKIASGSDILGPNQHLKGRELALKAAIMSPMGAIVATTKTNAELLGLADQIGTVESGKIADLIVVDGNPLENINLFERGLDKVLLVMKAGEIYKNRLNTH